MSSRSIHRWYLCLLVFLAAGCGTTDVTEHGEDAEARAIQESRDQARVAPGWLNPMTLEIHTRQRQPEPDDLVLSGTLDGWLFTPAGEIRGKLRPLPSSPSVKKCRLILKNRSLWYEGDGPIDGAYLEGAFDQESKLFYPAGRQFLTAEK